MQPCDLSQAADCQALVDLAVKTYGRVDVLFNNAAMAYFNWIEDISDEEWDRNRREEVDLVFYLTRAAWRHLRPRLPSSIARIITVSSRFSIRSRRRRFRPPILRGQFAAYSAASVTRG